MKIRIWKSLVLRRNPALIILDYVLGMLYSSSQWILEITLENDDGGDGGSNSRTYYCLVYSGLQRLHSRYIISFNPYNHLGDRHSPP